MSTLTFRKTLTANDVGATGGHQSGVTTPKTNRELFEMLPKLDATVKNPRVLLECLDEHGERHSLTFIYYNNKLHDPKGTRNEYRITPLTDYFRRANAKEGDAFEISKNTLEGFYRIRLVKKEQVEEEASCLPRRIKLTGWHRVH
ncbi:restriction endonuclease [Rhodovulum tesquicola]|uniref:EcoRII N-terminal effector-binding domain-containing protein n=1 Tax=Rhodovulum tesquicola TaxID=540254 RepID=UPI00209840D7|nr:EcoRII N-terminal effector-binding domain-containing protein [Rhodovulum tesquicola]MCO8146923.1 restriction endonuclease [Rhodovulum tesquicola]